MPNQPGLLRYPANLDDLDSLVRAVDDLALQIVADVATVGQTTVDVGYSNAQGVPISGVILLDTEIIVYTGMTGTVLTGCLRGQYGTTAATHAIGAQALWNVFAIHHQITASAMIALQTKLGTGASTPPGNFAKLRSAAAGGSEWYMEEMFVQSGGADHTLANQTAAQSIFPSDRDTITLLSDRIYEIRGQIDFWTNSTVSLARSLLFGGTWTSTTAPLVIDAGPRSATVSLVSPTARAVTWTPKTATQLEAASATQGYNIITVQGIIRTNTSGGGGTFIPQVSMSAAPNNSTYTLAGSHLILRDLGPSSTTSQFGGWG